MMAHFVHYSLRAINWLGDIQTIPNTHSTGASFFGPVNSALGESVPMNIDHLTKQSYGALIYDEQKEYKEVINALKLYLWGQPENAHALNNLGVAYLELGNHKKAFQAFDLAIKANPDNVTPHINKGDLSRKQQAFEQAVICYTNAIQIQGNATHYLCRAYAYVDLEQFDLALKDSEVAQKLAPQNKYAQTLIDKIRKLQNELGK